MILVTGATGTVGSLLLEALHRSGTSPVRGLTRDPQRAAAFPAGAEAVEGDFARPETLKRALDGVRSLFLVPGFGGEADVLAAARSAGVEHVVLLGSLGSGTHPHLVTARERLAVEQALKDSGMAWTVLRPTQFDSNALWWAASIRQHGAVFAPFPDTGLPAVHPADIAAVAHAALTDPAHRGRTYPLTGPETVSPRQQTAAIAEALGRELSCVEVARAAAHQQYAVGLGDEVAKEVLDLMGGDPRPGMFEVHDTVQRVTGLPARTFAQWARENVAAFR
ncbi:NAD(P)H-binding protein [Streptomyces morookaense]|uniref:NAD(P)H-binding protein n=1 Tax=Streptomyces morookaense TaxID=1970 RepID=A0A7Y7AZQ1_STRMO|nr:NAD(P)H-binding protein [Streptomyces morookaense]NVK76149.1 NAD(P)H-binding protein [Streptomyces morookaense]GHF37690.1 NmrA family transcriptional regulator [Streptomyces morookaense]